MLWRGVSTDPQARTHGWAGAITLTKKGRTAALPQMNVLLLSMPDSFEHTAPVAMRMPTGALCSLAGNVDSHHSVSVADLVLVQDRVAETIRDLVDRVRPDVVGLSIMTFQRRTAMRVVSLVRSLAPNAHVVVGGYDPSLAPEAYEAPGAQVDFIVRGEGELTFRELLRAIEGTKDYAAVAGLSFRSGGAFHRTVPRPVSRLAGGEIRLPDRNARLLEGYTLLGRPIDMVETSRGCTFDCGFCSIVGMRGRNFHKYPIDRVLADIRDAMAHGARVVFMVDDNITLDIPRFEALCRAIVEAGLNGADYIVQATTASIADHGPGLAPLMKKAGFRYVFLGIENIFDEDLEFLGATAKNGRRNGGRGAGGTALRAIDVLHRNGMYVVGGMIVGNPDDTRESIEANIAFARRHVDWPYIQHPTPYPGTPMADDYRARDLIVSENPEEYDGTTAVVKTRFLAAEEVEFLRWKPERWMKTRHMPPAFAHSPLFILRNWHRMLAHTFRGSTFRSVLGLESQRRVFDRYRAIRRAERNYLPDEKLQGRGGETAAMPSGPASGRE
jgi:anaerobic magnesium-protoporphyrin IX monomethyl ester cyclase